MVGQDLMWSSVVASGKSRIDLAVCAQCAHYDPGPPAGCWLGLAHRDLKKRVGAHRLMSMRLGESPVCGLQRRACGQWPTRPRVGFITPALMFGGADRWVAALACGLDPNRFEVMGVAVLNVEWTMPAIVTKVRTRCPVFEGGSHLSQLVEQCDILIVWGVFDLSMLAEFVQQRGGRVVVVSHGYCEWTVQCFRSGASYVTDWVAVSRDAALSFSDPARVAVIHNGIDVDRCAPQQTREAVRAAWGVGPGEMVVGYVGRFSEEKRPLAAVEAVAKLGLPFRAVLVGGGPSLDQWLTEARRLDPNVIYQPPVENVGDMYRAMDCFVLASPSEGFSLSLAEAWYCSCPTVATPVGAVEVVEEHGPLYVEVPVGATGEQLADAVRRAISIENRLIVDRAARVVAAHYTVEDMCRRWEVFLSQL